MDAYLVAVEPHSGALEADPGSMKVHSRALEEAHPGPVEVYLGAVKPHPVALEAHPGAMEAHPGPVVVILGPWGSSFGQAGSP